MNFKPIHTLLGLLFIFFLPIGNATAFSDANFSIISANGFSCSRNEEMVTCRGSFPGEPSPVFEATGYNVVWIRGEYPGKRFTYYSDSGCLCRAEFKTEGEVKTQECTSRFGHLKSFKGGKSTYEWCREN